MVCVCMQEFPGNLLEHNYPDPNNPRQLIARSEVGRRENYFEHLDRKLRESAGYPLVGVIKQCMENIPGERPTAEQLVRVLKGLKGDIDGPYGELAMIDAVRQVKTVQMKVNSGGFDELMASKEEIQHLQQQLKVL